jgi:biopolymer transport protein ExbD
MRVRKPDDEPFEIMLIPMIDCMLVIIIFFLVATTLKNKQKELPLELPGAGSALTVVQPQDVFVIGVDKTGRVFLGGDNFVEPVDNERLHRELRQLAQASPNRKVRIDADRNARFEEVVRIVDLCNFEGLRNVGLRTRGERAR